MQMVMCDKCNKPIDHTHIYQLTLTGAMHFNCDDPMGLKYVTDCVPKELPAFAYESPQKKAV